MFHKQNPTAHNLQRWAGIAKTLVDYLENYKKQQEFLREIDRRISGSQEVSRRDLLQFVVQKVYDLLPVNRVSFYLSSGANLVLEVSSSEALPPPPVIALEALSASFCSWDYNTGLWDRTTAEAFPFDFHGATVLAVPTGQGKRPLGMLLVEADQDVRYTQLGDAEVCHFLTTVAGQAAVALKFHEKLAAETTLLQFMNKLFLPPHDHTSKLNAIAQHFKELSPHCEADCPGASVHVQILFVEHEGETPVLTIRGSTDMDSNPGLTQVDVKRSVCGLLVTDTSRPYILCNPKTDERYKGLYKAYLGLNEDSDIQSELAIPLHEEGTGKRIAILNLESTQAEAFSKESVAQYLRKAEQFTSIIAAFKTRIEENTLAQASTLQALETYLQLLSTQHRHALRTPLLALGQGLLLLRQSLSSMDEKTETLLGNLDQSVLAVSTLGNDLANDINGFACPKVHDIKTLLVGALRLFNQETLLKEKHIRFDAKLEAGLMVECSLFMKQVFYNIIHNAELWLDKKRAAQPGHQGRIAITLEPAAPPPDSQEVRRNQFCIITIEDNGPGVPPENLDKIMNNAFTMRGPEGTGFGLYAARQYVLSLGGTIKIESEYTKNFKVTINLRRSTEKPK